jgi:hypothetical protein
VITDLFHGQFKSTVSCSKCPRVSVTFDPMMTMLLPIPAEKKPITFFYVPYNLCDGYVNNRGELTVRSNETVMDFREAMKVKYGKGLADYTITKVNNNEFTKYFSSA